MRLPLASCALVVVFLCAPAHAQEVADDVLRIVDNPLAINRLASEMALAFEAGDAAAVASLMTENALTMPPNSAAIGGRGRIQSFYDAVFSDLLEGFEIEYSITIVESKVCRDWAFSQGIYELVMTPRDGGQAAMITGTDIWILERQTDGEWRIARDIWNSDKPFPTQ